MAIFLTRIEVNKVLHLHGFKINIDDRQKKHLILTGKNGSGKTSILNAIVDFLQLVKNDVNLNFLQLEKNIESQKDYIEDLKRQQNLTGMASAEGGLRHLQDELERFFGSINLCFNNLYELSTKMRDNDFLLSYYTADRVTKVNVIKNPTKPDLSPVQDIKTSKVSEFLTFLVDLKFQEALARNENQLEAADHIKAWFISFEALLKDLFEDQSLTLEFHYRDYSFTILQGVRRFGFDKLSAGYSAIIDIVADLILKMQDQNVLTRAYEKEGIVLIDEVETHLHLKLQRVILPMLTRIFPNIQFIISTHSPFVLSSLDNAIAYDLERFLRLEDLTEYSYNALAEGYFEVNLISGHLSAKLQRFKELSAKSVKDEAELAEYKIIDQEFLDMDSAAMPANIKAEYLKLKLVSNK